MHLEIVLQVNFGLWDTSSLTTEHLMWILMHWGAKITVNMQNITKLCNNDKTVIPRYFMAIPYRLNFFWYRPILYLTYRFYIALFTTVYWCNCLMISRVLALTSGLRHGSICWATCHLTKQTVIVWCWGGRKSESYGVIIMMMTVFVCVVHAWSMVPGRLSQLLVKHHCFIVIA